MPLVESGSPAPAFSLRDKNGKIHTLASYRGKKLILYFYPQDDTPGCTVEAQGFRTGLPKLSKLKAAVVGVSPDNADSHTAFAKKYKLNFPLLSDEPMSGTPDTCNRYGIWLPRKDDPKTMHVKRTTYLIDENGMVAHRWDNVDVNKHFDEIHDFLAGKAETAGKAMKSAKKSAAKAVKKTAKKAAKAVTKAADKTARKADTAAGRSGSPALRKAAKVVKKATKAVSRTAKKVERTIAKKVTKAAKRSRR